MAGNRKQLGILEGDGEMLIATEQTCKDIVGREDAFVTVESVFAAMAKGDANNFPVAREAIGYADAL